MSSHDDRLAASGRRWGVGHVRRGMAADYEDPQTSSQIPAEAKVAKELRQLGCDVYCPLICRTFTWRRRGKRERREIHRAVFQGYIFVDVFTVRNMEAIHALPDFHYFIMNNGRISLVRDDAIQQLKALEVRGILIPTSIERMLGHFQMGDVVRVDDGLLKGYRGTVVSEQNGRVMLNGLDFINPVEIDADDLVFEQAGRTSS